MIEIWTRDTRKASFSDLAEALAHALTHTSFTASGSNPTPEPGSGPAY